jgi:hypothetical protein
VLDKHLKHPYKKINQRRRTMTDYKEGDRLIVTKHRPNYSSLLSGEVVEVQRKSTESGYRVKRQVDPYSWYVGEDYLERAPFHTRYTTPVVDFAEGDVVVGHINTKSASVPSGVMKVVEVQGSSFIAKYLNESGTYTYVEAQCSEWYKAV